MNQTDPLVGQYRLLRLLGRGMSDVYLAEHIEKHTTVAIKILKARLTHEDEVQRFVIEAGMIALKHPNIVPVHDFGVSQKGFPFLVMEYIPHGTLRDQHPRGTQVALPLVVRYVKDVAAALGYAYQERRLIHRDVKPENMLLQADGTVLLSDFGVATIARTTGSLASGEEFIGTPLYMSPEQLHDRARCASDQYSLAVVVYEWLAGRCPFVGKLAEVVQQHETEPPPPLRALAPTLPEAVEHVIFKALEKNYRDRYSSVQEFADALEAAMNEGSWTVPNLAVDPKSSLLESVGGANWPVTTPTPLHQGLLPTGPSWRASRVSCHTNTSIPVTRFLSNSDT
jgi:serine/threonine protein kinase